MLTVLTTFHRVSPFLIILTTVTFPFITLVTVSLFLPSMSMVTQTYPSPPPLTLKKQILNPRPTDEQTSGREIRQTKGEAGSQGQAGGWHERIQYRWKNLAAKQSGQELGPEGQRRDELPRAWGQSSLVSTTLYLNPTSLSSAWLPAKIRHPEDRRWSLQGT